MKWVKTVDKNEHLFVVVSSYKEIKVIGSETNISGNYLSIKKSLKRFSINSIFFHYLAPQMALLARDLKYKKMVWVLWGGDFYNLPSIRDKYLHSESQPFLQTSYLKDFIANRFVLPLIDRMDYIACNKADWGQINETGFGQKGKHLDLNALFPFSHYEQNIPINGSKLLLGNSDDAFNNHFMLLDWLSVKNKDHKSILPLSGVTNKYTEAIKEKIAAENLDIEVLDHFIEPQAFYEKMKEVSVLLFGHYRQQGLGTIFSLLSSGRTLVLSSRNPLCSLFKSWGLFFYTFEENNYPEIRSSIKDKTLESNKSILVEKLDEKVIRNQWNKIIN